VKISDESQPPENSLLWMMVKKKKNCGEFHFMLTFLFQVKVSIYKNGVEKAFILFNATGADKMSWFTPSRIIDSSWVDLKSTTTQYFNMAKYALVCLYVCLFV
jgi:hypothetical protein